MLASAEEVILMYPWLVGQLPGRSGIQRGSVMPWPGSGKLSGAEGSSVGVGVAINRLSGHRALPTPAPRGLAPGV